MEVIGQLHTPAAVPPGKEHPVAIRYEVGWAPEPVWTLWSGEGSARNGNRTQGVQPVAIPTELSQLRTFRKVKRIFYVAGKLLASQEGLCSVEIIMIFEV
jgi:hypothetical protein